MRHLFAVPGATPSRPTLLGVVVLTILVFGVFALLKRPSERDTRFPQTSPSPPLKTPACSTSCANPYSSRPPPPTCSRSSAARHSIYKRCSTHSPSRRRIFAAQTGLPSG